MTEKEGVEGCPYKRCMPNKHCKNCRDMELRGNYAKGGHNTKFN